MISTSFPLSRYTYITKKEVNILTENKVLTITNGSLRYINDYNLCIQRKTRGKGFIYLNPLGKIIRSRKLIGRFEALVIPPAWKDVFISDDVNGHIQAVGRDSKGRRQYIYHEKWKEFSNTNKFNKLIEFGENLSAIRKYVAKDLRRKSFLRDKVSAVIIKLLEETLIRIGNIKYAEENKSYGLTTLKNNHIRVTGITVKFEFNGKGGKPVSVELKNKTLSRIIKKCQDLPGQHLFQYIDEEGKLQSVESADVNNYLNTIVEKNFTAKDFRTWGATVYAAELLNDLPLSENDKANDRNIIAAIKQTAKKLNNTSAICRKYYIHPDIFNAYKDGYLFKAMTQTSVRNSRSGLSGSEKAVLKILKKYS